MLTVGCSIMFETRHTAYTGSSEMRLSYQYDSSLIQYSPSAKTEECLSSVYKMEGKGEVAPVKAVKAYVRFCVCVCVYK